MDSWTADQPGRLPVPPRRAQRAGGALPGAKRLHAGGQHPRRHRRLVPASATRPCRATEPLRLPASPPRHLNRTSHERPCSATRLPCCRPSPAPLGAGRAAGAGRRSAPGAEPGGAVRRGARLRRRPTSRPARSTTPTCPGPSRPRPACCRRPAWACRAPTGRAATASRGAGPQLQQPERHADRPASRCTARPTGHLRAGQAPGRAGQGPARRPPSRT